MLDGALYNPGDAELVALRSRAQALMRDYNATILGDDSRQAILANLLGACGAGTAIRTPMFVDYGSNIFLGSDVFLNYGCVILDVCPVYIGNGTQIGPNTQILTADHPRERIGRESGLEMGRGISVGSHVWIGGGVIILPGVRIGDGAIIGAGAVVTRDVSAGDTVAGNPARPLVKRGPTT